MDNQNPKFNITPPTPQGAGNTPPNPPTPQPEIGVTIKPVRTYADDIKEAVEKHDVSVAKIIVQETKKREEEAQIKEESSRNPRNIALVLMGILFILGGVGGFAFFYLQSKKPPPAVVIPEYKSDIIKTESYKEINVSNLFKTEIINSLLTTQNENQLTDTIKEVTFTTGEAPAVQPIYTQQLLTLLESRTPPFLLRAIDYRFLFGYHAKNGNHPFLILKVDTFDNGYAGMIDWEETIADDIGPIFFDRAKALQKTESTSSTEIATSTEETASTTATSTQSTSGTLQPLPDFVDAVIRNKDIRVLTDVNGKMIMMYGFADTTTIVITTNPMTFNEVSDRLKAAKLIR